MVPPHIERRGHPAQILGTFMPGGLFVLSHMCGAIVEALELFEMTILAQRRVVSMA
jgi:hypothetical protein